MASGNTLVIFTPLGNEPPAATYATLDTRNAHPTLDFDDMTDETAQWTATLPRNYSGGGLTLTLIWAASSATTGNIIWDAQFERLEDEGTNTAADSFAAVQSVTAAAPGTNGALQYSTIAFTAGSQMDSVVAGEAFRLRVTRDANNGSDTMVGDAELFAVEMRET
jgi:hypothetical protein